VLARAATSTTRTSPAVVTARAPRSVNERSQCNRISRRDVGPSHEHGQVPSARVSSCCKESIGSTHTAWAAVTLPRARQVVTNTHYGSAGCRRRAQSGSSDRSRWSLPTAMINASICTSWHRSLR
jgi:hypothetical protein